MGNFHNELQKAAELVQLIREEFSEFDSDLEIDSIEGETELLNILDWFVERIAEAEGSEKILQDQINRLRDRKDIFVRRQKRLKSLVEYAMGAIDQRKVERPMATLYISARPPKVTVINPELIPDKFIHTEKRPDLVAIKKAIKDGQAVEGVAMSNGGEGLNIRR